MEIKQVKRALLSVTNKTGLVDFARQLSTMAIYTAQLTPTRV